MNVYIYSRKEIERLIDNDFPTNVAVISFFDPCIKGYYAEYQPVNLKNKCQKVFYVCVHDIDIDSLEEYGFTLETFFPEADELAKFIIQAQRAGLEIICQCEYGESRSSACASAILEYYYHKGISIFADYRYCPNQLIFNKLLNALISQDIK